ncbi:MAG: Arabinose operon regulatory protein [Lentisphaerae bacterium ADurb.Bin242]|nr:MAG: Arabinose operon regulatory protein [Lentisphaerae bacterium ADurb.Bin242]
MEYELLDAGRFQGERPVPFHAHGGAELIYVRSGKCAIEMEGRSFPGIPGTLYAVPPGIPHNQTHTERTETWFCRFRTRESKSRTEWDSSFTQETGRDHWIERWFGDILELCVQSMPLPGDGLIAAILHRMDLLENKNRREAALPEHVLSAMDFIRENCVSQITLEEIARHAGLSVSRLKTLFRESVGTGAMQYLQGVRMRKAERMLLSPYWRISEVSEACGYPDACYFTFLFRKKHGMSPGEFRRRSLK